jgi:Tol biopolymer transport system component
VDHQTVANLVAGEFRQDLLDAGVCVDGNCSFSTALWGLISSYEPHRVDVWAQDDTGEWVLLSNSAKTLTCRTYDIYTFDPGSGGTIQITNLPETNEYNPRWSPDGKKIVHDVWNLDWSSHGVYITDVNTGGSTPLAGAEGGSYPTWSPSNKWIAFDRGADNDYRVFIVSPSGGVPKLVAEDAFMATWAPNSKRLAFHRPSDGGIWTTDLDGGNQTKVAERGNGPAWSPDGEWIAFEVDGDVWKVRVNNAGTRLAIPSS